MLLCTESLAVLPKKKVRLFRHALSLKIIAFILAIQSSNLSLPACECEMKKLWKLLQATTEWEREKTNTRSKNSFLDFFPFLCSSLRVEVHHHHHHLFCGMFWKFFNLGSFKFSLFWFYIYIFLKRRNELACGEIWVGGNDNFYCCWLRWWITAQRLVGIIVISIKREKASASIT